MSAQEFPNPVLSFHQTGLIVLAALGYIRENRKTDFLIAFGQLSVLEMNYPNIKDSENYQKISDYLQKEFGDSF